MQPGQGGGNIFGAGQGGLFARPAQPGAAPAQQAPAQQGGALFGSGLGAPLINQNPPQGGGQPNFQNQNPQQTPLLNNANQANPGQIQLGQVLNPQLPNQLNQQPQQQQKQLDFPQFIERCRTNTNKHLDNILKSAEIKDKIDKNQETLKQIDKVTLKTTDQLNRYNVQPNQLNLNQQQLPKPIDKKPVPQEDQVQYTWKTEQGYQKFTDSLKSLNKNQDDTIKNLTNLKRALTDKINNAYPSMVVGTQEEGVGNNIGILSKDIEQVNKDIDDVIKMQNRLLSQMQDDGDHWEHSYKALYGCLMQLNDDINETENVLAIVENHPKLKSK